MQNNCSAAMSTTTAPAPTLTADLLDRPTRLLAGPGAGKTQALVDLYIELVQSGRAARGQILVLTFSTAAAREIAQRLDDRLHDSYDEAPIGTFHSFCLRLLRDHRPDPGSLLMSTFQEWLAMRQVLQEHDGARLGTLARVARTDSFAQDALAFVALLKQNEVHHRAVSLLAQTSGTPRLKALAEVYSAYQARLDGAGLRDFRDLSSDAIALLEARPEVAEGLRRKYRYLLVDEFQDVDPAQFHLLRTLAPPGSSPRLLVAGDPDQSIYGFRGTVPRLLADDFARVYGERSIHLDASHRCPPSVLAVGRSLLEATQVSRSPLSRGGSPPLTPPAREARASGTPLSRGGSPPLTPPARETQASGTPLSQEGNPRLMPEARETQASGTPLSQEGNPRLMPEAARFASARPEPERGGPAVRVAREATAVDEAFFVAREIRRLMLEDPNLRPGDFAVLLRSTTTLSAPFEEAIRALDLPYEVRGVGALARNEVVRFLLTYLRAVREPDDPESLERLLASGLSGVGPRGAGRLRRHAIEEGRVFAKVVRRLLIWLHATDAAKWPLPWGGGEQE